MPHYYHYFSNLYSILQSHTNCLHSCKIIALKLNLVTDGKYNIGNDIRVMGVGRGGQGDSCPLHSNFSQYFINFLIDVNRVWRLSPPSPSYEYCISHSTMFVSVSLCIYSLLVYLARFFING